MNIEDVYKFEMNKLNALAAKMPWQDKKFYANWCAQTYYFVNHSTRLLAMVAAYVPPTGPQGVHQRFLKHAMEESGHETMAKKDVKKLGFELNQFKELTETKNFYQSQYYSIQHIHPASFFGYILCLEGVAVEQAGVVAEKVKNYHGKDIARFLDVHAGEDPAHLDKAFQSLKELDSGVQKLVMENFVRSCENYAHIMMSLYSASVPVSKEVAA